MRTPRSSPSACARSVDNPRFRPRTGLSRRPRWLRLLPRPLVPSQRIELDGGPSIVYGCCPEMARAPSSSTTTTTSSHPNCSTCGATSPSLPTSLMAHLGTRRLGQGQPGRSCAPSRPIKRFLVDCAARHAGVRSEEEVGSPHLHQFTNSPRGAELLRADACIWEAGYKDPTGRRLRSVATIMYVELRGRSARTCIRRGPRWCRTPPGG